MRIATNPVRDLQAEERSWHMWWAWRPVRTGAIGVLYDYEIGRPRHWVWREWVMRRRVEFGVGDPAMWEYKLCGERPERVMKCK